MKNIRFTDLAIAITLLLVTWHLNKRLSDTEQLLYNAYLELEAERLKLNNHLLEEHCIIPAYLDNTGALTQYYGHD